MFSFCKLCPGLDIKATNSHLKKHGLSVKEHIIYWKGFPEGSNQDFFDSIDTEEKAYWLGFIVADGHISKNGENVTVELCAKDREHLGRLASLFNCKVSDRSRRKTGKNPSSEFKHMSAARFGSTYMNHSLALKGLNHEKSKTLSSEIFGFIPDGLYSHFIRGYFDGDGSVGFYKMACACMVGTPNFILKLKDIIENSCGMQVYYSPRPNINSYYVRIHSYIKVRKLYDFLYRDATVWLERKKRAFAESLAKSRVHSL